MYGRLFAASAGARRRGSCWQRTSARSGEDFDTALIDAFERQDPAGDVLKVVRAPMHDNHFQTVIVVEVDVKGGADAATEVVLELGEFLAQVPYVVIVDQREGGYGLCAASDASFVHGGPHEITQSFGSSSASSCDQLIELAEE